MFSSIFGLNTTGGVDISIRERSKAFISIADSGLSCIYYCYIKIHMLTLFHAGVQCFSCTTSFDCMSPVKEQKLFRSLSVVVF